MTMNVDDTPEPAARDEPPQRKSKLRSLIALFTGGMAASDSEPRAAPTMRSDSATSGRVGVNHREAPDDYPSHRYVPDGWRLTYIATPRKHGFGSATDVMWLFGRPNSNANYSFPLQVIVSKESSGQLWGTAGVSPEIRPLQRAGGITEAGYFNGMWSPDPSGTRVSSDGGRWSWNTNNGHALICRLSDFVIAVRGYREAGVTEDELVRVAEGVV